MEDFESNTVVHIKTNFDARNDIGQRHWATEGKQTSNTAGSEMFVEIYQRSVESCGVIMSHVPSAPSSDLIAVKSPNSSLVLAWISFNDR